MTTEETLVELYQRRAWEKRRVAELEDELRRIREWEANTKDLIEAVT